MLGLPSPVAAAANLFGRRGQLGVLIGRAARGTTWVLLDRFLAAHEASPKRRGRRRAAAGVA